MFEIFSYRIINKKHNKSSNSAGGTKHYSPVNYAFFLLQHQLKLLETTLASTALCSK